MTNSVLLETKNLYQQFDQNRSGLGKDKVHALNGVSVKLYKGETLGIVGETGCGKSTLCRTLIRLYKPTEGSIIFEDMDITRLGEKKLRNLRQSMQMVFQDPADSMNSRINVGYVIEEPLIIQTKLNSKERKERALELLRQVGLPEDAYFRYPHEFSGGQRQRIAIARALALNPKILVCDEAVSALDVSVQAQILNLLLDLQEKKGLTMLFISHDLSVVRHMSDRVAVMYLGSIVEISSSKAIYEGAKHPYTQGLISAIPQPDPTLKNREIINTGEIPSSINLPKGCPYHLNCIHKMDICCKEKPELAEVEDGHQVACHLFKHL